MIRILIGSLAGAIAMWVVGFILWGTPIADIAYANASEQGSAAVQAALATNLPHTGRYIVPDVSSQAGTMLYGRGPVAVVDVNMSGFPATDTGSLVGGFAQDFVVVLMFGLALLPIASRVNDFASRGRVVVGIASAAAVMIQLADPIYNHTDWRFAAYALVADILMLSAGGLVLARWFLPYAAPRVTHYEDRAG